MWRSHSRRFSYVGIWLPFKDDILTTIHCHWWLRLILHLRRRIGLLLIILSIFSWHCQYSVFQNSLESANKLSCQLHSWPWPWPWWHWCWGTFSTPKNFWSSWTMDFNYSIPISNPPPGDPDPDDDPVRNFLLVALFLRLSSSSSSNGL